VGLGVEGEEKTSLGVEEIKGRIHVPRSKSTENETPKFDQGIKVQKKENPFNIWFDHQKNRKEPGGKKNPQRERRG